MLFLTAKHKYVANIRNRRHAVYSTCMGTFA